MQLVRGMSGASTVCKRSGSVITVCSRSLLAGNVSGNVGFAHSVKAARELRHALDTLNAPFGITHLSHIVVIPQSAKAKRAARTYCGVSVLQIPGDGSCLFRAGTRATRA